MSPVEADRTIAAFFDDFVAAFATFDGNAVGRLFTTPGVALRGDGTLKGFAKQAEVDAYYQAALDQYRTEACTSCRYARLNTDFLNRDSAVATASWDLLRADGTVISHWRQAYFMSRFGSGPWRIYGSAFVSDDT